MKPTETKAVGGPDGGGSSSSSSGYAATYGPQYDVPDWQLGWQPAPLPRWKDYGIVAAGERDDEENDPEALPEFEIHRYRNARRPGMPTSGMD